MVSSERTPTEWFQEAARYHAQAFQGCPWCETFNCVYCSEREDRIEYQCGNCSFFACYEPTTGRYFMTPGHPRKGQPAPQTMHQL